MKEKMTVLEALSALKIADDKILTALGGMNLVAANRNSAKKVNGIRREDFDTDAKASFQSVTDLIARYNAMKGAISRFNAATEITIGDKTMTVAEAIYQKNHGIALKKEFLSTLQNQLRNAEKMRDRENGDKLDESAERHAKQNFEGDIKSDKSRYLEFLDDYKEKNQYILIDPLNIKEKIKKLADEIAEFEAAVDSKIQIANATNEIEFEY